MAIENLDVIIKVLYLKKDQNCIHNSVYKIKRKEFMKVL